jgi:hypothetical protein
MMESIGLVNFPASESCDAVLQRQMVFQQPPTAWVWRETAKMVVDAQAAGLFTDQRVLHAIQPAARSLP